VFFFTFHYGEVDIINKLEILRLEFLKGNSLKTYVYLTFFSLFYSVKYGMYDRATVMDAPNPALSFSSNISTFFLGNDWKTNVTENSVMLRGVAYTIFTFRNFEDVPLTLEGPLW